MDRTAVDSMPGTSRLHGAGPALSTESTIPFTSEQERRSAVPVIGLTPTRPVTLDVGTSVMPDSARMA
jgi:hypothetical protein